MMVLAQASNMRATDVGFQFFFSSCTKQKYDIIRFFCTKQLGYDLLCNHSRTGILEAYISIAQGLKTGEKGELFNSNILLNYDTSSILNSVCPRFTHQALNAIHFYQDDNVSVLESKKYKRQTENFKVSAAHAIWIDLLTQSTLWKCIALL